MSSEYERLDDNEFAKKRRRVLITVAIVLTVAVVAGHFASIHPSDVIFFHMDASVDEFSPLACVASESSYPVLGGYDVVKYFSLAEGEDAVLGSNANAANFRGYTFHFSSQENMDSFNKSPHTFLPQWGAFCAYGVSSEEFWTWPTVKDHGPAADPNTWLVQDGKLYLFMYEVPKRMFLTGSVDVKVNRGDAKWATWTDTDMNNYFNTGCFWWDSKCGHDSDICIDDYLGLDEIDRPSYQRPVPTWATEVAFSSQ